MCEWIEPDALQADVLSSSTIKKTFVAKLKPKAILPEGWPSDVWECDDPLVNAGKPVCAKGQATVGKQPCDDCRTEAVEACKKPLAEVSMSPASQTARPPLSDARP